MYCAPARLIDDVCEASEAVVKLGVVPVLPVLLPLGLVPETAGIVDVLPYEKPAEAVAPASTSSTVPDGNGVAIWVSNAHLLPQQLSQAGNTGL